MYLFKLSKQLTARIAPEVCNSLISTLQDSVKLSVYICYVTTYCLLTQYCAGDKIEKNEMGGACGTYGGRERCAQGFGGET